MNRLYLYSIGAKKLLDSPIKKLSKEEAEKLREEFLARYPQIKSWSDKMRTDVQ